MKLAFATIAAWVALLAPLDGWSRCGYYPSTPDQLGSADFSDAIKTDFWIKATYHPIHYPKPESRQAYNNLLIQLAQKIFQPDQMRESFNDCPQYAVRIGDLLEEVLEQQDDLREAFKKEIRVGSHKAGGNPFHFWIDYPGGDRYHDSVFSGRRFPSELFVDPHRVFVKGDNEYLIEVITTLWIQTFAKAILSEPKGKIRTRMFKTLLASLEQNDGWGPVAKWSRIFRSLGTLLSYEETWMYFAGPFHSTVPIVRSRFESEMRRFQKYRYLMHSTDQNTFNERLLEWTYGCDATRFEEALFALLTADRAITATSTVGFDAPNYEVLRQQTDGYFFDAMLRELPHGHWLLTQGFDHALMPVLEQVRACQRPYALLEIFQRYYDQMIVTTNLDFQIALLREGKKAYQEEAFDPGRR